MVRSLLRSEGAWEGWTLYARGKGLWQIWNLSSVIQQERVEGQAGMEMASDLVYLCWAAVGFV